MLTLTERDDLRVGHGYITQQSGDWLCVYDADGMLVRVGRAPQPKVPARPVAAVAAVLVAAALLYVAAALWMAL